MEKDVDTLDDEQTEESEMNWIDDEEGMTPLMRAVKNNKDVADIGKILKEQEHPIDKADNYRRTALMYAVAWSEPKIVEMIIKAGADINAQDNDGNTSLHWAVWRVGNDNPTEDSDVDVEN